MKFTRTFIFLLVSLYFISCGTQHKTPYYLEHVDTTGKGEVTVPDLRFQKNDLLCIQIYSISTKPEVSDAIYNFPCGSNSTGGILVDNNGNIQYPRLGTIHAEGMTKPELEAEIKKRLTQPVELLKDPTVIIRFLNYRITVLGQVGHEGVINVPAERINILEAVGMAGGVTDFGKKDAIKIYRETNGQRQVGYIDLSSKDLFNSPYYYLAQNDVVVVEPTRQKARQVDQSVVAQRITFALGLITSAAFIYNVFK